MIKLHTLHDLTGEDTRLCTSLIEAMTLAFLCDVTVDLWLPSEKRLNTIDIKKFAGHRQSMSCQMRNTEYSRNDFITGREETWRIHGGAQHGYC